MNLFFFCQTITSSVQFISTNGISLPKNRNILLLNATPAIKTSLVESSQTSLKTFEEEIKYLMDLVQSCSPLPTTNCWAPNISSIFQIVKTSSQNDVETPRADCAMSPSSR